jgi:gamma-glutamylcysteine synthetase
LVNFWVPRQFVLDIDRASAGPSAKGRNTALVNAWWVALVAHTAAAVLAVCVIERLTAQQGAALRAVSPVEPLAHA